MALAAIQRAKKERARNTSPVPERNCRLVLTSESTNFSEPGTEITGKLYIDNVSNESISLAGMRRIAIITYHLSLQPQATHISYPYAFIPLYTGILVRCEINNVIRFGTRTSGITQSHSKLDNILVDENWAKVYVFGEDCKLEGVFNIIIGFSFRRSMIGQFK